jgi:hypothetical protein
LLDPHKAGQNLSLDKHIRPNGHLVGGFNPSEKYESVGMILHIYYGNKHKKCPKPPTTYKWLWAIFWEGNTNAQSDVQSEPSMFY